MSEEPPVVDTGEAPTAPEPTATAPQVSSAPEAVLGGSSFADATTIGSGRFTGTIVPGEAQMFRVPLSFGQHVQVQFYVPRPTAAVADKITSIGPFVTMRTYNPMHAGLTGASGSTRSDYLGRDRAVTLLDATPVVSRAEALNNRADASLAGDYYIGLSVKKFDASFEAPYRLDVQVVDDDGTAPTYADGKKWNLDDQADAASSRSESTSGSKTGSKTGSTSRGEASRTTSAKPAADGTSATIRLVGASGLGLIALLCVVAAVMLLRRRTT